MLNSFFYLVKQGFKNLWNNRLMSLASIGVLVSCMRLIGAAALLSVNVSSIVEAVEDQSEARDIRRLFQRFLKPCFTR